MAKRRMFNSQIIGSDAFLDMPLTTQALYFHLNMDADDDGFLNSSKRIIRTINANKNDFDLLIAKGFIIVFENGVTVIKHWLIHNTVRKDRKKPTVYVEELKRLKIKGNSSYTLNNGNDNQMATKWQPDDSVIEVKLSEVNLIEEKIDKKEKAPLKKTYGEFKNVKLTDEEFNKLETRIKNYNEYIEKLSAYLEQKGKQYKSHYATILNWSRKDNEGKKEERFTGKYGTYL